MFEFMRIWFYICISFRKHAKISIWFGSVSNHCNIYLTLHRIAISLGKASRTFVSKSLVEHLALSCVFASSSFVSSLSFCWSSRPLRMWCTASPFFSRMTWHCTSESPSSVTGYLDLVSVSTILASPTNPAQLMTHFIPWRASANLLQVSSVSTTGGDRCKGKYSF